MKSNEQHKVLSHSKLADQIDKITQDADRWLRKLGSIMQDPDLLLWKEVDIDGCRQVLELFSDLGKQDGKSPAEYISALNAAQHTLLNPESKRDESLIHLKESIHYIKVNLKGVHEIPKRIDFIEEDCLVLEKRMALLTEQRALIKTCLDRLRQPGMEDMMSLVENISGFTEKKEMQRANRIIQLMKKSSLNGEEDGLATIVSSIKTIDRALSSYEIVKKDTFHIFSQILFTKYRNVIHGMVQSLIAKLDDVYQKNHELVQNHRDERSALISPPNFTSIKKICKEYETRASHYRDFLLRISKGSDLPERLKAMKSMRRILRQLTENLDHVEDEIKASMSDSVSQFYLKPALFSETAYHRHLGRFKKIFIIPINFIRKLMGKKVIGKNTLKTFINKNDDFTLDESPIKVKMRINAFLRKEKYPEKIGKFLEENFYRYLQEIEKYVGAYCHDKKSLPSPSVNLSIKQLEKHLKDF